MLRWREVCRADSQWLSREASLKMRSSVLGETIVPEDGDSCRSERSMIAGGLCEGPKFHAGTGGLFALIPRLA